MISPCSLDTCKSPLQVWADVKGMNRIGSNGVERARSPSQPGATRVGAGLEG